MLASSFLVSILLIVATEALCPKDIVTFVDNLLANPDYSAASWRINITYLDPKTQTLTPIYAHLPTTFAVPASNNKLVTTSAAFKVFGPNFTTNTKGFFNSKNSQLCVKASGDAWLSHADLAQFASDVKSSLPTSSKIDLIVDNSLFGDEEVPEGWEWGDMFYDYGAPPMPAILDHNLIYLSVSAGPSIGSPTHITFKHKEDAGSMPMKNRVKTSSASVSPNIFLSFKFSDPGVLYLDGHVPLGGGQNIEVPVHNAGSRLALTLSNHFQNLGITINSVSSTLTPTCPNSDFQQVGEIVSPQLSKIMNFTLQTSDNLEAEIWCRLLGLVSPDLTLTNYENGLNKILEVHKTMGIDNNRFYQTDGSGLGRSNLLQASGLVDILYAMRDSREYISYLPIGGVSGTLQGRFVGTPAAGRVHAKTGTISGISSLSGYLYPKDFKDIIFSIIINESSDLPTSQVRKAIDSIIVQCAMLESNCDDDEIFQ